MLEIRKNLLSKDRTVHERMRARRMALRTFVAISVLLALLIVTAIVYVWYMGRYANQITQPIVETPTKQTLQPYKPAFDAPVGIVQQSFSGTVSPGSVAKISIKTNPGAVCQILVRAPKEPLPDTALVPKTADAYGIADWSWTVPKDIAPAKWSVEVTCANEAKKSGFYRAYLEVK